MAHHSSTLAWKIPWMEEPGRLQSTGSLRVGHDWATSLSFFTFMHWRRKWQPTPVFLPGESQGRGDRWAAIYGVAQSQTQLKWFSSSKTYKTIYTHIYLASQLVLVVKNPPVNAGCVRDRSLMDLIPGLGRSPGGGHGNPVLYSCLENPMDKGAWQATGYMVTESDIIWGDLAHMCMHTHMHIDRYTSQLLYPFIHQWTQVVSMS